jgi:hypothetical protein
MKRKTCRASRRRYRHLSHITAQSTVLSLFSARTRFRHTVHIHFLIGIAYSSAEAYPHKWTNRGLNKREG